MTNNTTPIPDGWTETTLGEVCEKIGDGLHGTPIYSVNGEYYFVNGNNIKDGKLIIKADTKKICDIYDDTLCTPLRKDEILPSKIEGEIVKAFPNLENNMAKVKKVI